jgi:hypothetical protein
MSSPFPKLEGATLTQTQGFENLIGSYGNLVNLKTTAQRVDNNLARQQNVVPQIVGNTELLSQLTGAVPGAANVGGVPGAAIPGALA